MGSGIGMKEQDKPAFAKMLAATLEVYGQSVTRDATSIWWAALERYPLDAVRTAFGAHVQNPNTGRYPPKPADLIAAMNQNDGRPTADEAWSLCPKSEGTTTVWTEETKQAFFQAAYGLIEDDPIAARMAFKGAYDRLVSEARRNLQPVSWEVSLGFDVDSRRPVLERAVELGRISADVAAKLLPAPVTSNTVQKFIEDARGAQ